MRSLFRSSYPIFHSKAKLRISPPKSAVIPEWLNIAVSDAVMKYGYIYPVLWTKSVFCSYTLIHNVHSKTLFTEKNASKLPPPRAPQSKFPH